MADTAQTKKEGTQQIPKLKPRFYKSPLLPMILLVGTIAVLALDQAGYINLPHFGQSNVYEIPIEATIGVPYEYDFASELIPLLGADSGPAIYTFYLGSGVGFPPMGLILGIDGILKGTPTGKGGNFEVCVKDVGGRSVCKTFHLTVNSENKKVNVPPSNCPTTFNPPCHSVQNGAEMMGGPIPASCDCPSGSTYSGTMDTVSPGGPYKICICN